MSPAYNKRRLSGDQTAGVARSATCFEFPPEDGMTYTFPSRNRRAAGSLAVFQRI
jgi:hypothetical protein